jgi:hypothetical protein
MRHTIILLTIFILSYLNCFSQGVYNNNPHSKRDTVFEKVFSQIDSNLFYFPTNSHKPSVMNFKINWYSKQLIALKEPSIYRDSTRRETYRFTWLRSFHNPIAIRIEKLDNVYKLYWKLCSGDGGYAPGNLIIHKQKIIDKMAWYAFIELLRQIDYWKLNTFEEVSMGTDGAEWIIEGKRLNQYHWVERWTPNHESKYFKCCNFLIDLTDLVIPEKDKY